MKKILQVMSSLHRNGTETAIMNIYRNIDRTLYQFDFLIFDDQKMDFYDEIIALGGKVFVIPSRKKNIFGYIKRCWLFFKKYHKKYDIIHFNFCYLSLLLPFILARVYRIPKRIIHSHSSNYVGGKYNLILHKLFRRIDIKMCNTYIACSKEAQKWFFNNTSANAKCEIILNGIDLQKFSYKPLIRKEYRKSLSIPDDTVAIGQVGYFDPVKNHMFTLKLIQYFKKKNRNIKVFFIGEGGSLEKEIKEKIYEFGLSDTIELLGRRNDISNIFQAIDILIHPSLFEGLPLTLVEAQTSGLRVLTSETVSKDSKCTDNISFLPINKNLSVWEKEITKYLMYNRQDQYSTLTNSNFNIKNTVKRFASYYQN